MKIGVVGTGFMGQTHIECYSICGVKDFCVCDSNLENAQKLAGKYNGKAYADFDQMLENEKLDAISICVPTLLHNPFAIKALEKGVAVLCEKPLASSSKAAEEIINKAKETGTPLMVAHVLRFMKPYYYLKKATEDGRYGKLLSLSMRRQSTAPLWGVSNWFMDAKKSGGALIDMHIHETDIAVFLFGKPKFVVTVGDYMQCATLFGYDEVAVNAQSSWRKPKAYPFTSGFDANFEEATVVFDGEKVVVYTDEIITDVLENEPYPDYLNFDNIYQNEICYFLQNLEKGEFPYCPIEESLATTKLAYAERESIEAKKPIEINF